jgi:hypothetical protein
LTDGSSLSIQEPVSERTGAKALLEVMIGDTMPAIEGYLLILMATIG